MLEREIKGGEVQVFGITLEAEQCAHFVVERRGIDLLVTVTSPDSLPILKFENPAGEQSPIFVTFAAGAPGDYRVEVHPIDKWAAAGGYLIRFENTHVRGPLDEKRLTAASRTAEGRRLQLLETEASRRAALTEYEAALALWDELGDNFEAANTLHFMAQTYKALRMLDESVRRYEQTLARRADDEQASAYTLLGIAAAHRDLRNPLDALPLYERALSVFRQAKNRRGEAVTLYSIGLIHARQWNMTEALKYYEQALVLHTAEGNRYEEARTLNAMGGAYDVLLQPYEAMAYYERAIKDWGTTGDLTQKGNTLNNLGKLYDDFGEWQKALEYYNLALASYDQGEASEADAERYRASIRSKRATTLYNVGYLHIAAGDFKKALDYLRQSLELRDEPRGRAVTLAQMAYVEVLPDNPNNNPRAALEHCQQALQLQQSANDPRRAQTLTVMGMAQGALGDQTKALETFQRALDLQKNPKAPDLQGQARTLTKMGDTYASQGESEKALDCFGRARILWHTFGERDGEGLALFGAARVERSLGHTEAAIKQTEEAIALIEPLRANITDRQRRASYLAMKVGYYELYADLLMRKGGDAQMAAAFAASERARARSLLDLLSDARVEMSAGADKTLAALLESRRLLILRTRAATRRQAQAVLEKKAVPDVAAIGHEIDDLNIARNHVESRIKSEHPRYAALMFPQPLNAEEVRRLLDDDTILLEYFLGDERSYLWALTPAGISGYTLPPRREIDAAARRLKELLWKGKPIGDETAAETQTRLEKITEQYWHVAPALSETLLGPVAAQLKGKRLLIVADGELMYLPFGALPLPEATAGAAPRAGTSPVPLIKDHVVVNLPSASVLSALRQTARHTLAPKSIAVFADPVFEGDDPRIPQAARRGAPSHPAAKPLGELAEVARDLGEDDNGWIPSRLPASINEARYIRAAAPGSSLIEATGFDANREKATDPQLGRFSIIHFATHGILNEKRPELSGLVLSLYDRQGHFHEDGFLSLSDIYGLSLPADLIVLSACRSGLGKEVRGEGLIGLTRGFMYVGALRVVASLWQVDDEATAELMRLFYLKMFKEGLSPAEALKAAQISLSGQKRWSSPYYWAGFVLQGEWR
ncbi:MAG: CHAT domain-containing protein [Pyrinomonadaceae bacterium]